jgi:hypothetical protein
MLENLTNRGCGLDGIEACYSKESQIKRFSEAGWKNIECIDMYESYLNLPDLERVKKLEFLDDIEIFKQLLQHYSITTATNH